VIKADDRSLYGKKVSTRTKHERRAKLGMGDSREKEQSG
jgi:hypothetical protein